MTIASELSQLAEHVIVDLFNRNSHRIVRKEDVKVNATEDIVGNPHADTSTTIVPVRPTDMNGMSRVNYQRVDLDNFFGDEVLLIDWRKYNAISDILESVYANYGIQITAKEIYPVRIPKDFNRALTTLTLTVNVVNSVLYKGAITVKIYLDPLAHRVGNTMLNGFEIPKESINEHAN